ncbi:MAG: hypothetical protein V1721_04165 [Pseudomonadota bacterium]
MSIASNSSHALRALLNNRFSRQSRRRPSQDILNDALIKLIQKEVMSGLAGIFGDTPRKGEKGGAMIGDNAFTPFIGQPPVGGNFDRRQMEISIDEMVASTLMHGRQTSGVLRTLFGLVPSLIGR